MVMMGNLHEAPLLYLLQVRAAAAAAAPRRPALLTAAPCPRAPSAGSRPGRSTRGRATCSSRSTRTRASPTSIRSPTSSRVAPQRWRARRAHELAPRMRPAPCPSTAARAFAAVAARTFAARRLHAGESARLFDRQACAGRLPEHRRALDPRAAGGRCRWRARQPVGAHQRREWRGQDRSVQARPRVPHLRLPPRQVIPRARRLVRIGRVTGRWPKAPQEGLARDGRSARARRDFISGS